MEKIELKNGATRSRSSKRTPSRRTLTRLQRGHIVQLGNEEHLIVFVNECRARAVPRQKRTIVVKPLNGEEKTFQRHGRALDISPNSELEIVGYDYKWLEEQAALAAKEKEAARE